MVIASLAACSMEITRSAHLPYYAEQGLTAGGSDDNTGSAENTAASANTATSTTSTSTTTTLVDGGADSGLDSGARDAGDAGALAH